MRGLRFVELVLNSQLFHLLAVPGCQYVRYRREPRRKAATGQRAKVATVPAWPRRWEKRGRQWRSGGRQPRLPGPATECRSPGDQKQLAADLSHSSASARGNGGANARSGAGRFCSEIANRKGVAASEKRSSELKQLAGRRPGRRTRCTRVPRAC